MAYRVLIAQFMHETNTFSKLKTTLDDYRRRWLIDGEEMVPRFKGTRNEVGGYIDSADKYGWTPVYAAAANATPSGALTRETWETIRDKILDAAKKAGKLDAVCLSLHGAMVTETEDDAEGALLEALRRIVGPDVPMVATLDLHANATVKMAKNANALVSFRTYPHIDGYERAVQAAALVQEALTGKKKPRCLLSQPAMLEGADHGRTTQPGEMRDLLAKADVYEKEPGINVVSIQVGFTWSDIPYTGPSIAVSHEPEAAGRAGEICRALIDEIWRRRDETLSARKNGYRSVADGIAAARAKTDKQGPLVLADGTDNPGGGGYNDTTPVLRALLDAGIRNAAVGTIYDPDTVQQAMKAGVGAEIDVELGGHTDESMGKPVKAKAVVKMLSDGVFRNDGPMNAGVESNMGPTAVLRIGGIDVVTISNRIQTIDLQTFLSQGIDPRARDVLVVKSVQHFRAAYAPIAREIVLVDSGGICSPDISRLKFRKLRRPIWPLDGVNDPYAGARA
ncbi:MAG: M81 family metallopeptidase [Reyranella sp.]|uniref:M81 family metallopeptidase n=1 Tax=Reyranella sp. TaxID=1929291 RepID=UPI001ACB9C53|nr:M81 family metallopeptidase [Reyranella sp.]MBN9089513.1 M81 family metallopeptidase [Reyranella sp.]